MIVPMPTTLFLPRMFPAMGVSVNILVIPHAGLLMLVPDLFLSTD